MKRQAYLIGGNYRNTDDWLPGVIADISAWKEFLMSPHGGSWEKDEIWDLSELSPEDIRAALQTGRAVDYSLVCFSGHGYLTQDQWGFGLTMVWVDDVNKMSERELNPGSPWTMMILDCCRKREEKEKIALANEARRMHYWHNTRAFFEKELLKCEKGLVKVYAADEEEGADDERSFSRVLMEVAQHAIAHYSDGVLPINHAVALAKDEMPPQQNPVYRGGRRLHHFPFAVAPGVIYP